jgi:hypothetical protein
MARVFAPYGSENKNLKSIPRAEKKHDEAGKSSFFLSLVPFLQRHHRWRSSSCFPREASKEEGDVIAGGMIARECNEWL